MDKLTLFLFAKGFRGELVCADLNDAPPSPRSLVSFWASAYSTSCFSGLVPSAPTLTTLRMTSGSPMPNDHRMPKYSAM